MSHTHDVNNIYPSFEVLVEYGKNRIVNVYYHSVDIENWYLMSTYDYDRSGIFIYKEKIYRTHQIDFTAKIFIEKFNPSIVFFSTEIPDNLSQICEEVKAFVISNIDLFRHGEVIIEHQASKKKKLYFKVYNSSTLYICEELTLEPGCDIGKPGFSLNYQNIPSTIDKREFMYFLINNCCRRKLRYLFYKEYKIFIIKPLVDLFILCKYYFIKNVLNLEISGLHGSIAVLDKEKTSKISDYLSRHIYDNKHLQKISESITFAVKFKETKYILIHATFSKIKFN